MQRLRPGASIVVSISNPADLRFRPTPEAVEAAFRDSLLLQGWASADRIAAALCCAPALLILCFYFWWFVVSPRPRPTSYMSWKNFYFLQKRACNKFLEQIAHLSKMLAWAKCSPEQIAHLSNLLTLAKYLVRLKSSQPYSKGETKLPHAPSSKYVLDLRHSFTSLDGQRKNPTYANIPLFVNYRI